MERIKAAVTPQQWFGVKIALSLAALYLLVSLFVAWHTQMRVDAIILPDLDANSKPTVDSYNALVSSVVSNSKDEWSVALTSIQHVLDAFLTVAVALLFGSGAKSLIERRMKLMSADRELPSQQVEP